MEYKQTPLGEIPVEWKLTKIGDISEVKGGKRLPKGHKLVNYETEHPYIRVLDFKNMSVNLNNLKYLSNDTYFKIKNYIITSDDVYISIAGTIGVSGTIPTKLSGANLTENAAKLTDLKNINKYFLAYILNSSLVKPQINASTGKATQPKLALFRIKNIKIPLPPLLEQEKIADILSVTDKAIRKSDEIIVKTENLKRGVMQKLLIKGIGHNEFKDSAIGNIPVEWELVKLENVSKKITDGSHFSPKKYENGTHKIATVVNINDNSFDLKSCKTISEKDYEQLVKNDCKVKKGDVLFSKDGTVGLSFVYNQDADLVVLSSIAIIKPDLTLDPAYCSYALKSAPVFRQIIGSKRGTGLKRIILQDLKKIRIPLPPLLEQHQIVRVLSEIDHKLKLERQRNEKLQNIKKGLMNDLLTGHRRVQLNN